MADGDEQVDEQVDEQIDEQVDEQIEELKSQVQVLVKEVTAGMSGQPPSAAEGVSDESAGSLIRQLGLELSAADPKAKMKTGPEAPRPGQKTGLQESAAAAGGNHTSS